MALLGLGFACGWLSSKDRLLRYRWKFQGRFLLFVGHLLIAIWAMTDQASRQMVYLDYFCWNLAMALVNLLHFLYILCHEKPIRFHPALDLLWQHLFGPNHFNLDKIDFYYLTADRAEIRSYRPGEVYRCEQDVPNKLSILVDGKMAVYNSVEYGRREIALPVFFDAEASKEEKLGEIVGEIDKLEFIDSFEWIANGLNALQDSHSEVTIQAERECIVLTWDYDVLKEVFKDQPRLRACMLALVGADVTKKLLKITGRVLAGQNIWSDVVKKKDRWFMCWRDAGVRDEEAPELFVERPVVQQEHPAQDMDQIMERLRVANGRMLGLGASALETVQPSSGAPEKEEHGSTLLSLFNSVDPTLTLDDLSELVKWGKWRSYGKRLQHVFVRKGERPYYLGIVLEGYLDVCEEVETWKKKKGQPGVKSKVKSSIKQFELVGSEDFGARHGHARAKHTIRVGKKGAVMFVWDFKDLERLMLADPRVDSLMGTLLRADISHKLRGGLPAKLSDAKKAVEIILKGCCNGR